MYFSKTESGGREPATEEAPKTDSATRLALDALARLMVEARAEGLDDAETAVAAVSAAAAVYEHATGRAGFARQARRALAQAEALRLLELDARLIGAARGSA